MSSGVGFGRSILIVSLSIPYVLRMKEKRMFEIILAAALIVLFVALWGKTQASSAADSARKR